jgi:uracil-DNA glycosylase family 4
MNIDELETENLNVGGNPDAQIAVVCDSPSQNVWAAGNVMSTHAMNVFGQQAKDCGMTKDDFFFVTCSPPIPEEHAVSEGRVSKFVQPYGEELMRTLQQLQHCKLVIYLGKTAGRQVHGRSIKINSLRGRFQNLPINGRQVPVLPMLSPANVLRRPEVASIFNADFHQITAFREAGWNVKRYEAARVTTKYQWVTDLSAILANPPKALALDTETRGLWGKPLLATMSWGKGHGICIPLDHTYYTDMTEADERKLHAQLRNLLANPRVAVAGHNLGFDVAALRRINIEVANWYCDTMQLAFAADDNMLSKSLADCVKRWVPELAGYSDSFDATVDKEHMELVPLEKMLPYAAGDAEATFLLAQRLVKLVKEDSRQWTCFVKVQMPVLRMFVGMKEQGILINQEALRTLEEEMAVSERELYRKLIRRVPAEVKRKHIDKGLAFSRDEFVRDILFSKEGFGLTPVVFTKTTSMLKGAARIPSTSAKDHLPFFAEDNSFVVDLIQYQKLAKMRSTYVGRESKRVVTRVVMKKDGTMPAALGKKLERAGVELDLATRSALVQGVRARTRRRVLEFDDRQLNVALSVPIGEGADNLLVTDRDQLFLSQYSEPTGFWQHIMEDGRIHPSFHLHRVVTGRSSSSDPNAQNFPKRGALAKQYRKIFIPSDGYKIIEADLSQAELRIAAWMAGETTMLRIYREGGDIHAATAAAILGITMERFSALKGSKEEVPAKYKVGGFDGKTWGEYYDFKRFQAKAVNFGFLYGMGWKTFRVYAKTDYGLNLSEEQSIAMRRAFFALYPRLEAWHKSMRAFVQLHGYVRGLHGALRRLPSIDSDDEGVRGDCERQAINSPVQRFASDLGLIGMFRFCENAPRDVVRPLAFIHDAAVLEAREDCVRECAGGIKWAMQTPPLEEWFGIKSPIPILADVSVGTSLGATEELDVAAAAPSWIKIQC